MVDSAYKGFDDWVVDISSLLDITSQESVWTCTPFCAVPPLCEARSHMQPRSKGH